LCNLTIPGVMHPTGSTLVFASKSLFEAETEEGSKAPYSMYVPDLRMEATTLGDIFPPMASMAPYAILPPAKQEPMSNLVCSSEGKVLFLLRGFPRLATGGNREVLFPQLGVQYAADSNKHSNSQCLTLYAKKGHCMQKRAPRLKESNGELSLIVALISTLISLHTSSGCNN